MHVPLEQFLNSEAGAAKVMAHARLLLRLSRRYEAIVPAGLSHVSRVANYKSGKIVVHADNGAVAAKLRQMSGSLCQLLSVGGVECSVMDIKVQPRELAYQSSASRVKPISGRAAAVLRHTAESLPAGSDLRRAVENLLEKSLVEAPASKR